MNQENKERKGKTISDLPDGWQTEIADMFTKGCSQEEVLSYLGLNRLQNADFRKLYPEYDGIMDKGLIDSEAWFHRIGRQALEKDTRNFNHGLWWYHMKYRFGARDIPLDKNQKGNNLSNKTKEAEDIGKYRVTPTEEDFEVQDSKDIN
jgi:hypothetical protein